MSASREQIEIEATEMAAELKRPHAKPVVMALMEHQSGLPVDQSCAVCGAALEVVDHGTAWTVKCPCGKSTSTFRGL